MTKNGIDQCKITTKPKKQFIVMKVLVFNFEGNGVHVRYIQSIMLTCYYCCLYNLKIEAGPIF